MDHFAHTVRLIQARVNLVLPLAQKSVLIATIIGASFVTLGIVLIFGDESRRPPSVPWALTIGTDVLALVLALLVLSAIFYLALTFLLACLTLADFISRKKRNREKGRLKQAINELLREVGVTLNQKKRSH